MEKERLSATERRIAELFFISAKGSFNYSDIMEEFGISHAMVGKDIKYFRNVLGVPIESANGRSGGLRLYGSWSAHSKKLKQEQRETILFLIEQNDGKIRKVLISIIKDFSDSLLAEQLLKQYKEA